MPRVGPLLPSWKITTHDLFECPCLFSFTIQNLQLRPRLTGVDLRTRSSSCRGGSDRSFSRNWPSPLAEIGQLTAWGLLKWACIAQKFPLLLASVFMANVVLELTPHTQSKPPVHHWNQHRSFVTQLCLPRRCILVWSR